MNIAIVDDQLLLRQLLATSLEQSIAFCQTKEFSDALLFLDFDFSNWRPDLVIIDSIFPVIGAMDMIERTRKLVGGPCKFLIVSSSLNLNLIKFAIQKGVQGYVDKSASLNELLQAIDSVINGKQYIGQSLKEDLLAYLLADKPTAGGLSVRENEVFQRLCSGHSPKEIANEMNLSLHTVRQYTKLVLRKFNLKRTTDLMLYAYKKGLVKPMI